MRSAECGIKQLTTEHWLPTTNHERFEIRFPPVAEEPWLHRRGRAHPRARHRGHNFYFLLVKRLDSQTAALPGCRPACVDVGIVDRKGMGPFRRERRYV